MTPTMTLFPQANESGQTLFSQSGGGLAGFETLAHNPLQTGPRDQWNPTRSSVEPLQNS